MSKARPDPLTTIVPSKRVLRVGVTGGIGSGKSTVVSIFSSLGIPVFSADECAKTCMVTDKIVIREIKRLCGNEAYSLDGQLQREFIARNIFQNSELRKQLEQIVHPIVFRKEDEWFQRQVDVPYALLEAALIFESGNDRNLDFIVAVDADESTRISWIKKRDDESIGNIKKRMDAQLPASTIRELADFVIENNGTMEELQKKIFLLNIILQSYSKRGLNSLHEEEVDEGK